MSIEIFSLRDNGKINKLTQASSVRDIYANPKTFLAQIPEPEQYNIYFRLASEDTQEFIPVNINDVKEEDVDFVIDVACKRFQVEPTQVLSQRSGFGVQILIPLKTPITPEQYLNGFFSSRKDAYQQILDRIKSDLVDGELSGTPEPDVFARDVFMRMPETRNVRGKKQARAKIINNIAEPVDVDLLELNKDSLFDKASALISSYVKESQHQDQAFIPTPSEEKVLTKQFREVRIENGKPVYGKIKYYELVQYFDKLYSFKTIEKEGDTYVFDKTHYKLRTEDRLNEFVIKNTWNSNRADRSEFCAILLASNITPREWFSETTYKKINFKNGVLDLKTKKLMPHSKDFGFFYCLPYDYDPEAKCPTFDQHLRDVTCEDEDLQKILLEYMGYAISNDYPWTAKCLFLTGEGNNGKSTFVNTIKALAGAGNYSNIKIDNLTNQQNLAGIEGKLFNISEEGPQQLYKSGPFKNIVGGGIETIKKLYVQPYEIVIKTKMIVLCNELPRSPDTTKGFFRRFLIVPFDRTFTAQDEDPFIGQKIQAELSGIMNKVLYHYEQLHKNKHFTHSPKSIASTKEFMESNDAIRDWLSHCEYKFTADDKDFVSNQKLYESYRNFCLYNSHKIDTSRAFGAKLRKIDANFKTYGDAQRRIGNTVARGFSNLEIKLPIEIDTTRY